MNNPKDTEFKCHISGDRVVCPDLSDERKENGELKVEIGKLRAEVERLSKGHYKDDHRYHPLKEHCEKIETELSREHEKFCIAMVERDLERDIVEILKDHIEQMRAVEIKKRMIPEIEILADQALKYEKDLRAPR